MTFLDQTFNADDLPQGGGFDPVPAGNYTAAVTEASLETTKAGNGQYIKLRMDIEGPTHQGRVLFTNINIRNPNPKAEEIGRQQLGDIMRAIGLSQVSDTDQLIGGRLQVKVTVKQDETYGPSNECKGFKAVEGSVPPAPAQSAPPGNGQAQEQPAGAKPPWA